MIFRHLQTSSTSTSSAFLKQGNCDGLGCGIEDLGAHDSRCSSCHGNPQPTLPPQCWWKWGHGSATKCLSDVLSSIFFGQSVHLIVKVKLSTKYPVEQHRIDVWQSDTSLGKSHPRYAARSWLDGPRMKWQCNFCLPRPQLGNKII